MTERPDAQTADEPDAADSAYEGGGRINDPLTRRDVKAPRAPFQTSPAADE